MVYPALQGQCRFDPDIGLWFPSRERKAANLGGSTNSIFAFEFVIAVSLLNGADAVFRVGVHSGAPSVVFQVKSWSCVMRLILSARKRILFCMGTSRLQIALELVNRHYVTQ